jgi:thiol-disulfide isomerase/thioredoxin
VNSKGILIAAFILVIAGAVVVDRYITSGKSKGVSIQDVQTSLRPETWQSAPEVEFTALNQRKFSLEELQGKIVILNFWATWCPSCKVEFPALLKLVRFFKGQVVLVAVSVDQDKTAVEIFMQNLRLEFASELDGENVIIAWDPQRQITSDIFQTERFPEAIIISKDSRMSRKMVGAYDWESLEMKDYLSRLLAL